MNADEVRRRNWVLVPMGGPVIIPAYPKRIKGITKFGEFDFTEPTYPEDHIVPAKHCSGVPLTGEILLKAGFKEQGGAIFLGQRHKRHVMGRNSLYSINGKSYIFAVNDRDLCEIEYIHQLQNLFFALTGEELEINL